MISATLTAGLRDYDIGAKIRTLRLKKKMGLVELGQHTGLSPAMLSKIERGRLFPTLPTLLRIALVFGVGLEYFFAGAREKPLVAVVRKRERVRLPERPQTRDSACHFESLGPAADWRARKVPAPQTKISHRSRHASPRVVRTLQRDFRSPVTRAVAVRPVRL